MSGGSLEYACYKIEEIASSVRRRAERPIHKALADHLDIVAKALHDLEWVWSGDYSGGQEDEAIMAVVNPVDVLATATRDAEKALAELTAAISEAKETP